ncbi:MAG: divergent polysaccharide deacetylase family protein, partial [bacterium]
LKEIIILAPLGQPLLITYLKLSTLLQKNEFSIKKAYDTERDHEIAIHLENNDKTLKRVIKLRISESLEPNKVMLSLVFLNLGKEINSAVNSLLACKIPLTFGIIPGQTYSSEICGKAIKNGHEVIMQIPMESKIYPYKSGGHFTIMLHHNEEQIRVLINSMQYNIKGHSGFACYRGSRLFDDSGIIKNILAAIDSKKYYYLDNTLYDPPIIKQIADSLQLPCIVLENALGENPEKALNNCAAWAEKTGSAVLSAELNTRHLDFIRQSIPRMEKAGFKWVSVSQILKYKGLL